jgi:hypothetical protein
VVHLNLLVNKWNLEEAKEQATGEEAEEEEAEEQASEEEGDEEDDIDEEENSAKRRKAQWHSFVGSFLSFSDRKPS